MNLKYLKSIFSSYLNEMIGKNEEFSNNRRFTLGMSIMVIVLLNLSTATFLTGLLVLMKCDNTTIGIANMIPLLMSITQIFSPIFLNKFKEKKKPIIFFGAVHFILLSVGIGIIPFLPLDTSFKSTLVIIVLSLSYFSWSLIAPGFSIWHLKSMPKNIRPKFFAFNNMVVITITQLAMITASIILDSFKAQNNELIGYTILRGSSILLIFLFILFGIKLKDYKEEEKTEKLTLLKSIALPFQNKLYLQTIKLICIWGFVVFFIGPYYTIYLLKDLGVSFTFLNTVGLANMVVNIVLASYLPRLLTRFGIIKAYPILLFAQSLIWLSLPFLSRSNIYLGFTILTIVSYILIAGITNVCANIPFIYLPKKEQTSYLSAFNTITSSMNFLGGFLGVQFINLTNNLKINIFGVSMLNNRYIVLVGFLLGVLGAIYARILYKRIEKLKENFDEQLN